ncbi:hypothetical protein L6R50_23610 [Myxococcota bacterium]|nr:hypothetical protein [Myxococcota bacterium]
MPPAGLLLALALPLLGPATAAWGSADPVGEARGRLEAGDPGGAAALAEIGRRAAGAGDVEGAAAAVRALAEAGRAAEAATLGTSLLATRPVASGGKPIAFAAASALAEVGRSREAAALWREALDVPPRSPHEHAGGVDLWLRAGDAARAVEAARAGLREFPGRVVLLLAGSRASLAAGDVEAARAGVAAVLAAEPEDLAAWEQRCAVELVAGGGGAAARDAVAGFKRRYPDEAQPWAFAAVLARAQGDPAAAAAALSRAAELAGDCRCTEAARRLVEWARTQPGPDGRVTPPPP